jgi:hypothetical protein
VLDEQFKCRTIIDGTQQRGLPGWSLVEPYVAMDCPLDRAHRFE